jgi:hypothetical protein
MMAGTGNRDVEEGGLADVRAIREDAADHCAARLLHAAAHGPLAPTGNDRE